MVERGSLWGLSGFESNSAREKIGGEQEIIVIYVVLDDILRGALRGMMTEGSR